MADVLDKGCWQVVKSRILANACPANVGKPWSALEKITQDSTDESGNVHSMSVQAYYQMVMAATQAFLHDDIWGISVLDHFVSNLSPQIRAETELTFTAHRGQVSCKGDDQMRLLEDALKAATAAESKVKNLRKVISDSHTTALMAAGIPYGAGASASQEYDPGPPCSRGRSGGPIYASQAEQTLSRYSQPKNDWKPGACYACGGRHPYMRNKRIVCQAAIDNPELEQDANHNMRVHQFLRRSGAIPGQRNPPPRGSSYLGRMDTNQRRSLVGSLREDPTAFQSLVEAVQGSQDSPFLAPHHAFQASIPAGRGTTQRGSTFTWTPPLVGVVVVVDTAPGMTTITALRAVPTPTTNQMLLARGGMVSRSSSKS